MAIPDPRRITARYDAALAQLEAQQVQEMQRLLRTTQGRMEHELSRVYQDAYKQGVSQSIAWREDRARRMLEDVDRALGEFSVGKRLPKTKAIKQTIQQSRQLGYEQGRELLSLVDPKLKPIPGVVRAQLDTMDIRVESLAAAVRTSQARLVNHAMDAQRKINESVVQGLMRGQGWQKTAAELRQTTGMLHYQAERIIRTESLSNNDIARREAYAEHGVEYVQRIATQDDRVCEYCGYRAGNVYPINDAPAALHPNDRCYNMPWKPEWQALGLTNDEFFEDHRKGIKQAVQADGRKLNRGRAPFERMNNLETPKALWTPGVGQTKLGKQVLGDMSKLIKEWSPPPAAKPGPKPGTKKAPKPPPKKAPIKGGAKASNPKSKVSPKQSDPFAPVSEAEVKSAVMDEMQFMSGEDYSQASWFNSNVATFDEGKLIHNLHVRGQLEMKGHMEAALRRFQQVSSTRVAPVDALGHRVYSVPANTIPAPAQLSKMVGTEINNPYFTMLHSRRNYISEAISGGKLSTGQLSIGSTQAVVSMEVRVRAGQTRLFTVMNSSGEAGFVMPVGTRYRVVEAIQPTTSFGKPLTVGNSRRVHLVVEAVFDPTTAPDVVALAKMQWAVAPTAKVTMGPPPPKKPPTPQVSQPSPPPQPGGPSGPVAETQWTTSRNPVQGYAESVDLRSNSRVLENALTAPQTSGIRTYSGGSYQPINEALRKGRLPEGEHLKRAVTNIREAFKSPEARLPTNMQLHRGYSIPNNRVPNDVARMIGTDIVDKGFVSTSTDRGVAAKFMRMNSRGLRDRTGVMVRVRANKGTNGLAMEGMSNLPGEREFLLPDSTKFRVVDARNMDPESIGMPRSQRVIELVVEVVK